MKDEIPDPQLWAELRSLISINQLFVALVMKNIGFLESSGPETFPIPAIIAAKFHISECSRFLN